MLRIPLHKGWYQGWKSRNSGLKGYLQFGQMGVSCCTFTFIVLAIEIVFLGTVRTDQFTGVNYCPYRRWSFADPDVIEAQSAFRITPRFGDGQLFYSGAVLQHIDSQDHVAGLFPFVTALFNHGGYPIAIAPLGVAVKYFFSPESEIEVRVIQHCHNGVFGVYHFGGGNMACFIINELNSYVAAVIALQSAKGFRKVNHSLMD